MQLFAKFMRMQFYRYDCRSTRLEFRNTVLRYDSSTLDNWGLFCRKAIWYNFPLYFSEFSLYLQKVAAIGQILR